MPTMVSMTMSIIAVTPTMMMMMVVAVAYAGNVDDRTYHHMTRIRIHVDHAWSVAHHRRIVRLDLTPMITRMRVVDRDAHNGTCGCADHSALHPMIIVMSTN
jgi:hypothetical protein